MSEIYVPCPACETRIRFRDGLPDRESIDCPQCGEVIPIRRPSRPRQPAPRPREEYEAPPRRRRDERPPARQASSAPRRFQAGRKARQPSEGSSAGLWVGMIGGSIGLLGLILGVIFYSNSGKDSAAPEASKEKLVDAADATTPAINPGVPPSTNMNPIQQFVANVQPTPTSSTPNSSQPSALPAFNGANPTPTLNPGPDGVIPAPQGPGNSLAATNANKGLKYGWKTNHDFAYRTTIKVEVGNEVHNVSGLATYQVLGHDPAMAALIEEEEEETGGMATGTGFVVHSDGYLMTCAHVIEGGTKIEVVLGDRTYAARVVEVNTQRDLALIQIAARNLPVLPLQDSSRVELAEQVRLVGYPLSDLLGASVKVTQGSVAGFIERKNGRMIQVDASMNPGNSGGPLVNDRGEAIGVASSGYFGSEIAEVGLAIPTNDVAALMRKNGVTPTAAGTGKQLDGPGLAKKVTPSVAYLKVPLGSTQKESQVLKHFSTFTTTKIRTDGRSIPGNLPSSKSDSGKLLVNEAGQILHAEGGTQVLPFGLGPLSHLAFEPVSTDGESTWGTHRLTTVTQVQRDDSRYDPYSRYGGYPGSRYARPPRGLPRPIRPPSPYGPSSAETVKVHLALEACEYELAESTPTMQMIKKAYEFQTIDNVEQPYFRLSGNGNIRFDLSRSLPEEIHCTLQLQMRMDDGSMVRVPVDVLCQRLTDAELSQHNQRVADLTKQSQERAQANPAPATTTSPRPAPARPVESLDQHLATIKDPKANFSQKYIALNAVKGMTPDDKTRKSVLDAVEPLLRDSNSSLQTAAITLFGVWGTEDRASVLIEMAGGFSQSHRWAAMKALGTIGGKKSAEAVAKRLTDSTDMLTAARALKQMGPVAEEPVLKLVDNPDEQIRRYVYEVLGEVGGPQSRKVLEDKAKSETNISNRVAADIALRALQKR